MKSEQEFRRVFMPYCIQLLKDGRYIVLNRGYKPLGVHDFNTHVDYDTHPSACSMKITPATKKKLAITEHPSPDIIYLYNDATIPSKSKRNMDLYSAKLHILSKLNVSKLESE